MTKDDIAVDATAPQTPGHEPTSAAAMSHVEKPSAAVGSDDAAKDGASQTAKVAAAILAESTAPKLDAPQPTETLEPPRQMDRPTDAADANRTTADEPEKATATEPPADTTLIGALNADERLRADQVRSERTLWLSALFVTLLYVSLFAAQFLNLGGLAGIEQELAEQQRQRERMGQGAESISVELVPEPDFNAKTEKWNDGANQPPLPVPPQPQQQPTPPTPPIEQAQPVETPPEQQPPTEEQPEEKAEKEPEQEKEPEREEEKEREAENKQEEPREAQREEPSLSSLEAMLDAAANDLSEQVTAYYDRKPRRPRPQPQQQAMHSGGGMQVRGTGAGGKSDAFNKAVIDALMKTRPGPFAMWGRVLVTFQITQQGDLLYVRVLHSSGNKALDDAAVNAIHRAKFIKPPAGLSPDARTYIIDYIFG
ncbi:TonB family protein [Hyphomicrobium sulfonivorans]|uniref:TonB family protein n=1 Tax=Hyphomicrobium sulfonivorans TaxID=121290 RepID=UPI00156F9B56|nr:TonB family protein [Hyphomicrobium sulfonivorans]NSL72235.1 hypothetical protein [Hyphomicrobium sulfonivorans]